MDADATIRSLRTALAASPDNVRPRRHLADTLFAYDHSTDAEPELLALLNLAPDDEPATICMRG